MSKFSGIDATLISALNGKSFFSLSPTESENGVIYFEKGGFNNSVIDANSIFSESSVSLYKSQISDRTDIVSLKANAYHLYALSSSGVLYSMGGSNTSNMGRTVSGEGNEPYKLLESLTSVSKFAPHENGCWAVKTDGTLWWCGSITRYATSSDTGQGTVSSSNGWLQYGSDTDWLDVYSWTPYPTTSFAIKGSGGTEYLYSCGYNQYGKTGLGTTAGSTYGWTRVKSDSVTNWTETIDSVSCGYYSTSIISKNGKLYLMGEGQYHGCGQGTTTDQLYPIQENTNATNWVKTYDAGQAGVFAINSSNELYASTWATFYYEVRPSIVDRTFRQCGTDTDYEDMRFINNNNSTGAEIIFKKSTDGNWYYNANETTYMFGGSLGQSSGADDWKTINEALQGNDMTNTADITDILISFKLNNQTLGEVITMSISGST